MNTSIIIHPTRSKKPTKKINKTIQFEDHGQDFLEFDIRNSVVTACRPFQDWLWVGAKVRNSSIRKGSFLRIATKSCRLGLTLKYPIDRVMKLKPAAQP